jgi:hypothetical protein
MNEHLPLFLVSLINQTIYSFVFVQFYRCDTD